MAKHLKASDVAAIVNVLHGWKRARLTWDELCDEVKCLVGKRPTRQSLNHHPEIVSAFTSKKAELKVAGPKLRTPSSLAFAAQRIHNLESQVKDLQRRNSLLLEYLTLLQYNAYKNGLTEEVITAPLPSIDRDRSEA
ncbi:MULTISPECIES: hypothetical protein [Pseudomonas]|uniref:Uncharacterized protein n=1 Tax=Pseudomonas putida NBRC 14164 TaxID=1211579 RepID=A0ABM7EA87_PSEPU|nr:MULTISPECIES: hypothetical protein [Pseudomonas]MCX9136039.1 hypothetical protein [Pseudomonas sp. DCB_PUT]MDD1971903.1 hypothetical protein [Pseudomonas putida]MDO1464129.1 hypothetical protein [Pseudomonas putida]MDO1469506.1 hypothetical protein [Pseudomonas putida]MDZ7325189.1 hypothetical protein [Pseudomonas sp. SDS3-8]